jgi:hypothetical protein
MGGDKVICDTYTEFRANKKILLNAGRKIC